MTRLPTIAAVALMVIATPARAGPPFLTDDPEPTETGHWEVYAPLFEAEGSGDNFEGTFGAEVNFGAARNTQLTAGLPAAYTRDAQGWHWGAGDLEVSVKYRFYNNEVYEVQVAAFPGITLPTASDGLGAKHVTALLPVWAQKDFGQWSLFGGGGYAINPGRLNRDYWTGGVALTRRFGDQFMLGIEADRQGSDAIDGSASTSVGLGASYDLVGPLRLLGSGGPTFRDDGTGGFHAFAALGMDF